MNATDKAKSEGVIGAKMSLKSLSSVRAGDEDLRFKEIEHKFIVPPDFDVEKFAEQIKRIGFDHFSEVDVLDTYYLINDRPGMVFRHRVDRELQHLSVKSTRGDNVVRTEINLNLGTHAGDQSSAVAAFMGMLTVAWHGQIHKRVRAWHLKDCEIVHYSAVAGARRVSCVEFEATRKDDRSGALGILADYESRLGFDATTRSPQSLFELLLVPEIPTLIRTTLL